jgi:predicted  nucleic acid-binding Zn-ribbon protein
LHPDVKKLLDLQRIDQTIARMTRDVSSLPAERARREAELARLRAAYEKANAELQACEVAIRNTDNSVRESDAEIQKLEGRLNTVKNNAEYQATLLQIASVKRERGQAEEEGLEHIERLDGLKAAVEETSKALEDEQKVFAEFEAEAEKLKAQREEEVKDVRAEREAKLAEVPRELQQIYERLSPARSGEAVVACEGDMCLGCYTTITPNLHARLMSGTAVVQCGSCQRILYPASS